MPSLQVGSAVGAREGGLAVEGGSVGAMVGAAVGVPGATGAQVGLVVGVAVGLVGAEQLGQKAAGSPRAGCSWVPRLDPEASQQGHHGS